MISRVAWVPLLLLVLLCHVISATDWQTSQDSQNQPPDLKDQDHDTELAEVVKRLESQDANVEEPGFLRQIRKYSRRLWHINCSARRRRLCHCYSRQIRQYFCCDCDGGPCFPKDTHADTPQGPIAMANLSVGQIVLAGDELGHVVESQVLGFLDKRPDEEAVYTTLTTKSGRRVTLSGNHLIFVTYDNMTSDEAEPMAASLVTPGQYLLTLQDNASDPLTLTQDPVISVNHSLLRGAYVPLTEHGTLVVGGALASCYASFPHALAHWALTPARLAPTLLLDTKISQHYPGLRLFPRILKAVGRAFLPSLDPNTQNQILKFDLRPFES